MRARIFLPFIAILVLLLASVAWIRSDTGRMFVQTRISAWLEQKYHIALQYRSLTVQPSTFGWTLLFQDLIGTYAPDKPQQHVRRLSLDVNLWQIFFGSHPVSAIAVQGATLQAPLADLLAFSKQGSGDGQLLKKIDITLDDIHADLGFPLALAATWSGGAVTRLELNSAGFDLTPALQEFLPASLQRFKQGRVEKLQLSCQGWDACRGSAALHNVEMEADQWIPGVRNVSGFLEFQPQAIAVKIPASTYTFTWPKVYRHPLLIAVQPTEVALRYDDQQLLITVPKTQLVWKGVPATAQARIEVPWQAPRKTVLRLSATVKQASWIAVAGVLPDQVFSPKLNQWLAQRIPAGTIKNVEAGFDGEVLQLKNLRIQADFTGVPLQYHDAWPLLERCSGQFRLQKAAIRIQDIRCKTDGLLVAGASLDIPKLDQPHPEVQVRFTVHSALGEALRFLSLTPLRKVSQVFGVIPVRGRQSTSVQLKVDTGIELSGQTQIKGLHFSLPDELFTGTADRVDLQFDQAGLQELTAVVKAQSDQTRVLVQRDKQKLGLDVSLEPVEPKPGALSGHVRCTPADAPQIVEGSLSGFVLGQDAARVNIEAVRWQAEPPLLAVKGDAQIQDFGAVSRALGLPDEYKGGQGTAQFDVSFPGIPSGAVALALSGQARLDLKKGRIKKLSKTWVSLVHFADLKVFGIKSDELAYDFAKGQIQFTGGTLRTDNAHIGLGAVEVQAFGSIDYRQDAIDMNMKIIPDLGSPAVAVGIGLWNPLVGLGLFGISKLQDKASDSRLNRLVAQTYKVHGKIDKPEFSLVKTMDLREIVR